MSEAMEALKAAIQTVYDCATPETRLRIEDRVLNKRVNMTDRVLVFYIGEGHGEEPEKNIERDWSFCLLGLATPEEDLEYYDLLDEFDRETLKQVFSCHLNQSAIYDAWDNAYTESSSEAKRVVRETVAALAKR